MPLQRYVSNELTHFVKGPDPDAQYGILWKILREGLLTPWADDPEQASMWEVHTSARVSDESMFKGRYVSFCDIPVSELDIHMSKYSPFGIAFTKTFLLQNGANPVFYVANDSLVPRPRRDLAQALHELHDKGEAATDPAVVDVGEVKSRIEIFDEVLASHQQIFMTLRTLDNDTLQGLGLPDKLTIQRVETFHDAHVGYFIKPFTGDLPEDDRANVYMEREWRVPGNVHFELLDVTRAVASRSFARSFSDDFPDYTGQVHFVD